MDSSTAMPCTCGLPNLRGFVVQGLEISENTFHSFRIVKKKNWKRVDLNNTIFLCPVKEPDFHYRHIAEEKKFAISIPKGPDVIVRLCYDLLLCEDLETSSKRLISSSQNSSLSYENLLPCLCIEAFYTHRDSKREKKCPFQDHPEPYIEKLLQVSVKEVHHPSNTMTVRFSSPCPLVPTVTFCRKQNGSCVRENETIVKEHAKEYYLESVDRDHHLCFEFSSLNHSYIKCPDVGDRFWDMKAKIELYYVLLTISSDIAASFSAAVCRKNPQTGGCDLKSKVYNVSTHYKFGSDDLQLSLPWPGIGDCIKNWGIKAAFFYVQRYTCPVVGTIDSMVLYMRRGYIQVTDITYVSHNHLGLLALVASLAIFTMILIIYTSCRRMWKIFTAPLWRRTILLVYSPDSAEYKTLICDFADFLHGILGCEVILDLWDMNTVSQIGMLPWFYQKRKLVSERKGKVMVIWTRRSTTMYDQWKKTANQQHRVEGPN
ncbi:unnamed protein product [Ranitomeya imitator]|uniref:Uncharacterized protein n=1 Tax=Ranitomeya imitator TaxID=111125 RepID=A0ABN9KXE9_9NEOB|nr:unnamed protein product [Ranitomeya imitator]